MGVRSHLTPQQSMVVHRLLRKYDRQYPRHAEMLAMTDRSHAPFRSIKSGWSLTHSMGQDTILFDVCKDFCLHRFIQTGGLEAAPPCTESAAAWAAAAADRIPHAPHVASGRPAEGTGSSRDHVDNTASSWNGDSPWLRRWRASSAGRPGTAT